MNLLPKSILVRVGLALGLIGVLSALAVGVASAAGSVALLTPPIEPAEQVYYNPGTSQPPVFTFIGTYPRYGAKYLKFSWVAYPFAPTAHGSYRVALAQNVTPLAYQPTWVEFMVSHTWADNPSGPVFTMGPFLRVYGLCDACPTKITVTAETYQAVQTPGTQDWQIVYTPVPPPTTPPVNVVFVPVVQQSIHFVIQTSSQARCDQSGGPDC